MGGGDRAKPGPGTKDRKGLLVSQLVAEILPEINSFAPVDEKCTPTVASILI